MKKRALPVLLAFIALALAFLPGCLTRPENRPPLAVFSTSARAVNVGEEIIFDASNSTDRDGKIVRYHWCFGDNQEDLGVCVAHTFSAGGDYKVVLTVTDNEGKKDRTNMTVHVNEYPIARIDVSSREAKVLAEVGFSAENSSDPDGSIVSCFWRFDDGTNSSGPRVAHAFNDPGSYVVELTVRDDFGASNRTAVSINVVLRTFEISWPLVQQALPQISDVSEENSTVNKTIELQYENMTMVEFRLTWQDDIRHWLLGQFNDDFLLKVIDPDNNTQYMRDMGGNITLNFTLTSSPRPLTIRARTAAEALREVGSKFATGAGRGNWTAVVWLGEAGGAQDLMNVDLDTGNSWKLDVVYYKFELVVTEK